MRLVNTFIIAMYGVMNYSLFMSNVVAFYANLKKIIKKLNFILPWKFPSVFSLECWVYFVTFINQVFQWKTLVIKMMNVGGRLWGWPAASTFCFRNITLQSLETF